MAIHDVFPYLRIDGAAAAIDFYQRAFGAVEKFRAKGFVTPLPIPSEAQSA